MHSIALYVGVEMVNKYIVAGIVIIVIAIVGVALTLGNNGAAGGSGSQNITTAPRTAATQGAPQGGVVLALTDPPEVPPGTNSLTLSYTGIMLHEVGSSNATGFVDVNSSGSVDLLALTNVSQIVAIAKVPVNTSFDSIVFAGAAARITINGSSYNVTVPSSRLQIKVLGNLQNNSTALIDLAPSIVQVYGGANATQDVFVMVPFAKAVVVTNSSANVQVKVGARAQINIHERAQLEQGNANVSIGSASLAEHGNTMIVSVTVKNNGNASVTLRHLFIRGLLVTSFNGAVGAETGASTNLGVNIGAYPRYDYNTTTAIGLNASVNGKEGSNNPENSSHENSSGNGSVGVSIGNNANASLEDAIKSDLHESGNLSARARAYINGSIEFRHYMHSSLNFIIGANGTLSLPQTELEAEGQSGYVLTPGASVTLEYDKGATFGESGMGVQFISNQTYSVVVQGEEGAHAAVNATAT
ncbi:MAG: hypothetical protein M1321_00570 [Candidatus Marsarchaeota archaeon]|nr:hypothetical protein [Candidatus Marsarchaeota archaeon]